MSSKEGMDFGAEYGETYGLVVETWAKKVRGKKVSDDLKAKWAADLQKSLGEQLVKELLKGSSRWKAVGDLPPKKELQRLAEESMQESLANDMEDLLIRLSKMDPDPPESLTSSFFVGQAIKRGGQTVAQMFDMVKDKFDRTLGRFFVDGGKLTGRRRWRTSSLASRHRSLNYQVKKEEESFLINGESVYGPRPPGGSPASWSNCSCFIERERFDGGWESL